VIIGYHHTKRMKHALIGKRQLNLLSSHHGSEEHDPRRRSNPESDTSVGGRWPPHSTVPLSGGLSTSDEFTGRGEAEPGCGGGSRKVGVHRGVA